MTDTAEPKEKAQRASLPRVAAWLARFTPLAATVVAWAARPCLSAPAASVQVYDAGVFALAIVGLFRLFEGRYHLDALGLRVKGAAGAVFLWLICFGSILVALRTAAPL